MIVGLDASNMDKTIVPYAKYLTELYPIEKVYFVSIVKNLHKNDQIVKEYPELITNAISDRRKELNEQIDQSEFRNTLEMEFVVELGRTTWFIMDLAKEKSADLILIGRKITLNSTSTTGPRLARRAACNLLIVPEGTRPSNKKILVPIDFSPHSKKALHYAVEMARKFENTEITTQNVYSIPVGYYSLGKTKEEFGEIMRKNSVDEFNKFVSDLDLEGINITSIFDEDKDQDLTSDIIAKCKELKPDWLILGAKGRSTTTAYFMGSFAETVITSITNIPIFIARMKGKNAGFIDLLKEI